MTNDQNEGKTMGKAARNEIKKLQAAYLNGIAISFFVAGLVVPYLTLIKNLGDLENALSTHLLTEKSFQLAAMTITAIVFSIKIHFFARSFLKEIED